MSGINIPTCLWAQTKEAVYVTVDVPDVTDEKISVDANVLKFSAKSGGKQYECTMELFEPINAEESKYEVRGRNVFFSLKRRVWSLVFLWLLRTVVTNTASFEFIVVYCAHHNANRV